MFYNWYFLIAQVLLLLSQVLLLLLSSAAAANIQKRPIQYIICAWITTTR